MQSYNHIQAMVPLENHHQPPAHHTQPENLGWFLFFALGYIRQIIVFLMLVKPFVFFLSDNGNHSTPVPSPHHQQPSNDTAFPGGQLRHSYNLHQQQQQQGHLLNLAQHPPKPKLNVPKNSQVGRLKG
jgi:hypothetical protein